MMLNKNQSLDLNKVLAEKCRRSFYFFVQYFWNTIVADEPVWNWHIQYLCDELQVIGQRVAKREKKEFDYYIINIPPGSSKSIIVSEMYPLWCWTIDETQRFICGSYASTPAEDIAEKCFTIYSSEKFERLFAYLIRKSSGGKTHFRNGLLGERYTTSTGSGITGIHAHQKIIDDPMNPQIAASETERERANRWVSETLGSRNVSQDVTTTIIVMQRLHELDTTGYLLTREGLNIKHICIPAEMSDDVSPVELREMYIDGLFDPIRRSKASLLTAKAELGSYGYAGQMQQRPAPEEGGILKKQWFEIIDRGEIPGNVSINFQMDTAYTESLKNDPTGTLSYYISNDKLYITHAVSKWKEFPDLIEWLPVYLKAGGYTMTSKIHVEPKASGLSVVQTIKKKTNLNIIISDAPKDDKITRAHIISPLIESGKVILHKGSWNEDFLHQVTSFPYAAHDEYLDCLAAVLLRELVEKRKPSRLRYQLGYI